MNLETKRLQRVQIPQSNARPVVIRCHPTRSDIISLGLESGQVLFLKLGNQETYILNAHEDCAQVQIDETGQFPRGMMVEDLAWDPQEDNFLVSFADKSMSLVSYQGLREETVVVKRFEPQQHAINNIVWMTDRSGNFITSNEKIGTIQYWNVASKEPRLSTKIGAKGTNSMIFLDNEGHAGGRILFSLKNGALGVYNLKR